MSGSAVKRNIDGPESCPKCGHTMGERILVCVECGYEPLTGKNAFEEAKHLAEHLKYKPRKTYDYKPPKNKAASKELAALAVILFLCALVVGVVFGVYKLSENNLREQDREESAQSQRHETPSYNLTAQELYREYSANEVHADGKYKGSVVVVAGTVESIGKDMLGSAYVVIKGKDDVFGVQCLFASSHESSVAGMYKGEHVSIKGEVSGKMGNVIVRNCTQ